jgi:hypothetical protein
VPYQIPAIMVVSERGTMGEFNSGQVLVARGAGLKASEWGRDEAHFETLIDRRFEQGGPVLLAVKINDKPGTMATTRDPPLVRNRFMKGLGTGRGGVLDQ